MTESLPLAQTVRPRGSWSGPAGVVRLSYDDRFLRRRRLRAEDGTEFLVDLAETVSLAPGDALALEDGRLVEVRAAEEPLLEVRGPALARLAWHVGNRHTPCQIEEDRLLIREDHVLADMLRRLGATVRPVTAPFLPEGGAYGLGRTLGHDHGHGHEHGHEHGQHRHAHDHEVHDSRAHHVRGVHLHIAPPPEEPEAAPPPAEPE